MQLYDRFGLVEEQVAVAHKVLLASSMHALPLYLLSPPCSRLCELRSARHVLRCVPSPCCVSSLCSICLVGVLSFGVGSEVRQ